MRVTITNTGTGIATSTVSDGSGSYVVPDQIPGAYEVSAEQQGFQGITKSGITLLVDQKALVDLTLPVESTTQTVTVSSQAPLVQSSF